MYSSATLLNVTPILFPSPHSGILFLYIYITHVYNHMRVVSVPSFGDSFFIQLHRKTLPSQLRRCFRPLIRGFFFYQPNVKKITIYARKWFPSPHSGILFLYMKISSIIGKLMFPSPHSGILFLYTLYIKST